MGTAKGNYGRKMYSDPAWKKAVSDGNKLKRVKINKGCPKCGNSFYVERLLNKDGSQRISKRENKFCSRSCANTRNHSKSTKKKISESTKKGKTKYYCDNCKKEKRNRGKYGLCRSCSLEFRRLTMDSYQKYRLQCKFNFALSDYPDEFNFSLIKKNGWYKASNHGNNLNGISRDHIVSVFYGYQNNISSEIIKHPANCQLLMHNYNSSKHKKCDITIEELYDKIRTWNKKYNKKAVIVKLKI